MSVSLKTEGSIHWELSAHSPPSKPVRRACPPVPEARTHRWRLRCISSWIYWQFIIPSMAQGLSLDHSAGGVARGRCVVALEMMN